MMSEPDEAAVEAVAIESVGGADQWAFLGIDLRALYLNRARMILATAVVAGWRRDAERLRNLAARFEGHDDWGQTYTGAQIAAMLRGDG